MSDYYARKWVKGSFATKSDREAEDLVKRTVEVAWGCELVHYPDFYPIDFYVPHKDNPKELAALIEVKSRSVKSMTYPTVFLNARKYGNLIDRAQQLGIPSYFFIVYKDCIKYINVELVDGTYNEIGGCKQLVKARNDIEIVINIPIEDMETMDKCHAE